MCGGGGGGGAVSGGRGGRGQRWGVAINAFGEQIVLNNFAFVSWYHELN